MGHGLPFISSSLASLQHSPGHSQTESPPAPRHTERFHHQALLMASPIPGMLFLLPTILQFPSLVPPTLGSPSGPPGPLPAVKS